MVDTDYVLNDDEAALVLQHAIEATSSPEELVCQLRSQGVVLGVPAAPPGEVAPRTAACLRRSESVTAIDYAVVNVLELMQGALEAMTFSEAMARLRRANGGMRWNWFLELLVEQLSDKQGLELAVKSETQQPDS